MSLKNQAAAIGIAIGFEADLGLISVVVSHRHPVRPAAAGAGRRRYRAAIVS